MKRKLLSFSMALCLSAMGVSAFAQTNKCTCTLDRDYNTSSNGTAARLEVSDKIMGDWTTEKQNGNYVVTSDNRSNAITLEGWINFKSATHPETVETEDENGFWLYDNALATGRVLMGHRQGNYGGYGSAPSFSISVIGEKDGVYKMSIYSRPEGSGAEDLRSTAVDIPEGWFHLALVGSVTKNAGDDLYTLSYTMYVNGKVKQHVENTSYNSSNLPYLSDNTDDNWGCDISFGGSMECEFDDLMIWNKALDESEVISSINGYADGSFPTGLVGYYLCDNMKGTADGTHGVDKNLVGDYDLTLQGLTYDDIWGGAAVEFSAKAPLAYDRIKDITPIRQFARGTAPTFATTWFGNGDEAGFKYAVNTTASHLTIVDGYSADNITMSSECVGVYYNSDIYEYAPALVTTDMYQTNAPTTDPQYSYLKGGFDYAVTMPVTGVWQTIGFPTPVDLVSDDSDAGILLRPAYNFWYSWIKDDYTSLSDAYQDFEKVNDETSKTYLLDKDGVIAVPTARSGHTFRFYTQMNTPVVFRAKGYGYTSERLPEPGKVGFVANPYMTATNASEFCSGCTLYQLEESGWYMPTTNDVMVAPFGSVLVYNGNSANAPKAINTKATTGVVELEAMSDINVRGAKESIEVVTFEPATVTVYTVGGTMVANAQVEGTETFALPAGIYVVKAVAGSETETFKVVVE